MMMEKYGYVVIETVRDGEIGHWNTQGFCELHELSKGMEIVEELKKKYPTCQFELVVYEK